MSDAKWSKGFPEKRGMYLVELNDGDCIVTDAALLAFLDQSDKVMMKRVGDAVAWEDTCDDTAACAIAALRDMLEEKK